MHIAKYARSRKRLEKSGNGPLSISRFLMLPKQSLAVVMVYKNEQCEFCFQSLKSDHDAPCN